VYLGFYLSETEPSKGLRIPWKLKVDIPGITMKGFFVVVVRGMTVYAPCEV